MQTRLRPTQQSVQSRMRTWYRRMPGRLVAQAEQQQLDALLHSLTGNRVAQLGCVGHQSLLSGSPMPHHILVDGDVDSTDIDPSLYARPDALPFAAESLDVLVLPHTLEFNPDPQRILQECHRVLTPEGHLVIIGFNPHGLWGLLRWLQRHRDEAPWCGTFLGLSQLCNWIVALDFHIVRTRHFFFRPPLQHAAIMRALSGLEVLGKHRFFPFGGLYLVVAQKRVPAMTPIQLRWRIAPRRRVTALCWVENDTNR